MVSYQPITEEKELWSSFREGNREALTAIYNQYIVALYNYGLRITTDRELLEDSIQDLFFKLWKSRANLEDVSSIKFYLYRALKSNILDNIRKSKNTTLANSLTDSFVFGIVPPHEEYLIADEHQAAQYQQLRKAVEENLTPRQREAIILLYYDNLSYEEVAQLLSLTPKATYKLVYRAIKALQNCLDTDIAALIVLLHLLR